MTKEIQKLIGEVEVCEDTLKLSMLGALAEIIKEYGDEDEGTFFFDTDYTYWDEEGLEYTIDGLYLNEKNKITAWFRGASKEMNDETYVEELDNFSDIYHYVVYSIKNMEVELELYYEEGRGFFAVESDAVECGDIYSPYTKKRLLDKDEPNDAIRLFQSQSWYEEWEEEFGRYPSVAESVSVFLNTTSPFDFISCSFTWEKTGKGYPYWRDICDKWREMLSNEDFNEKGYED